MQETKLGDADAPVMAFAMAGYQLVHHGEGRWNGVAIAARDGLAVSDVVTNFGDGPVRDSGPGGLAADVGEDDFDPFDEARMVAATVDGLRVVSVYAPNGRVVGSPFYDGQAGLVRAPRALAGRRGRGRPGGTLDRRRGLQRRPDRRATSGIPRAAHGGTHVSEPERAAVAGPARARPDRRLPRPPRRARPLLVVGLPGRHVPQELRDAHRPAARRRRRRRRASSTPRSTGRRARAQPDPVRPRPGDRSTSTSPARRIDPDWEGALARIAKRVALSRVLARVVGLGDLPDDLPAAVDSRPSPPTSPTASSRSPSPSPRSR